jgi:hypothetical protein
MALRAARINGDAGGDRSAVSGQIDSITGVCGQAAEGSPHRCGAKRHPSSSVFKKQRAPKAKRFNY